jgi:two-component system, cell cycle sensor histidine kinase and response regulator CckA
MQAIEELHLLLFDSNPLPMWMVDEETLAFLAVNEAAISHYGYSREEFLAMSIKDIYLPEDLPRLLEMADRLREISNPGLNNAGVWKHLKKNTALIDVEVILQPLTWNGRRAQLVLARDVSESKRAEETLREVEELFSVFMDNNPAVCFMRDEVGRYVYANRAFAGLTKKPQSEIIGKTIFDMWPSEVAKTLLENDRLVFSAGRAMEFTERTLTSGGVWQEWLAMKFPFQDRSGRRFVGCVSIDITERKRLQDRLLQSQKMVAVGRLAGGIAQDFSNLLTTITTYCELLLERDGAVDPMRSQLVEIKKAGERAASLTRQLLAFSRRQALEPRVFDLNATLAHMNDTLRELLGAEIELVTVLGPEIKRVKADPGQIEQVILNLAMNARDAMPRGGRLTIATSNARLDEIFGPNQVRVRPGSYVLLRMSDTGVGIDPAALAHVFEPFFTTKEKGKGSELGLSTAYGIVKQSWGYIWASSEPGRGTTFKVYLPILAENKSEAPSPSKAAAKQSRGTETILLVEDEAAARSIAKSILKKHGYRVLAARGPEEAMQICEMEQGPIHLLVTDVIMPAMSGRQLAEHLAFLRPEMKVLYISGYTDNVVMQRGVLQTGHFLQKPFTTDSLTGKVREVLDSTAAEK